MNSPDVDMDLAGVVQTLASRYENNLRVGIKFEAIRWSDATATAEGTDGLTPFRVIVQFHGAPVEALSTCSICEDEDLCAHAQALFVEMKQSGIGTDIVWNEFRPAEYAPQTNEKTAPEPRWKATLGKLVEELKYAAPPEQLPAKFPIGREVIYFVQWNQFHRDPDSMDLVVATRPDHTPVPHSESARPKKGSEHVFRSLTGGIRTWAASPDPLDREIAAQAALTAQTYDYYNSHQGPRFSLRIDAGTDAIARLARSGRLYGNFEFEIHDRMTPLQWLSDEPFQLKFEVAPQDEEMLRLGVCAANAAATISSREFLVLKERYFADKTGRLGFFDRPVPVQLEAALRTGKPILVPRDSAPDLIEQVMNSPLKLGIEYVGCDDLRPPRIDSQPKARIRFRAPAPQADTLDAEVQFDYDGTMVPLGQPMPEFYDKARRALVKIDNAFHEDSRDLLIAAGAKVRQSYGTAQVRVTKHKLPSVAVILMRRGWHVEADGKLYRSGSTCDINIASGIDWFELQGTAHFDQASIDFPRLLQSLRAGERTVLLDDGTIGLIPEQWIARFGNLAELATTDGDVVKFGKSQVMLLDVLLADQGSVNVDEQFAAARQALAAFDRIQAEEAPTGFVGELRPYQKLALGWFAFLRTLGFGGCLADDMGLGKTIQVLALLEQRRQQKAGPSLIVVPRSLIFNWTAEARKFAPQLRVLDQSHSQRSRSTASLVDFDIVLTTYGTLRRDAAFLKDFEFDYLILDEAQAIKNSTTAAAKAARLLRGRHKLALSGTPIENHLGELWSLFEFLNPGMLGRVGRFTGVAQTDDAEQRKLLAGAVRPFVLRRTKKQVAPELPDRVEQTVVVELDTEQRRGYDELRNHYRQTLLNTVDTNGIGKSQFLILEALLRLRQAACHPGLIDKARVAEPSAKINELIARLTTAVEAGERILVFSQFTSLLGIVKLRLEQEHLDYLYLDGKTKDRQELVEQFQSGTGPAVFLISLKAGGVGLNLTAARTVILLDPWWNPAVEAQAIDRAHRIGQDQTVFATRLIAADTVEQKVLELQSRKRGLADAIINADNAGISSLTREDLEQLLA